MKIFFLIINYHLHIICIIYIIIHYNLTNQLTKEHKTWWVNAYQIQLKYWKNPCSSVYTVMIWSAEMRREGWTVWMNSSWRDGSFSWFCKMTLEWERKEESGRGRKELRGRNKKKVGKRRKKWERRKNTWARFDEGCNISTFFQSVFFTFSSLCSTHYFFLPFFTFFFCFQSIPVCYEETDELVMYRSLLSLSLETRHCKWWIHKRWNCWLDEYTN